MNTTKSVFNKVFAEKKTELNTQRVELKMSDYKKFMSELEKLDNTIEKEIESILKRFEAIREDRTEVSKKSMSVAKIFKQAEKQVEKDIKTANDLGVPSAAKAFYSEYQKIKNFESKIQKRINKLTVQMR